MPHRAAGSALRRGLGRGSARQHLQALWRARRQPQLDDCTRPPPQTHSTHTRAASRIAAAQHARAHARSTPPPCGRRHLAHTPPARTAAAAAPRAPAPHRAPSRRTSPVSVRERTSRHTPGVPPATSRTSKRRESGTRTCLFSFCLALMLARSEPEGAAEHSGVRGVVRGAGALVWRAARVLGAAGIAGGWRRTRPPAAGGWSLQTLQRPLKAFGFDAPRCGAPRGWCLVRGARGSHQEDYDQESAPIRRTGRADAAPSASTS